MSKKESTERKRLWDGVEEDDYRNELYVEERDMGEFNKEKMALYALNATCSRHMIDATDSLKPVERRILYTMFLTKAYNHGSGSKKKSQSIVGETNKFHPHGGGTIYETLIGMAQYWKKGIPLITIHGSKGDPTIKKFAAERYTEATISPYAFECFFETFDPSCVAMELAPNRVDYIPISIPTKFPNILLNGGIGIAYGYSFAIPPYNPSDVIMATKRLLKDPEDHNFYIYPDLPTGCNIVEDGGELRTICETGRGKLHMRAQIDILEEKNKWILRITSVPWLSSPLDIKDDIATLQKKGIAQIDDVQDKSDQFKLNDGSIVTDIIIDVIINKALDPYVIREILYKNTTLDRTIPIQFRMVQNGLEIIQKDLYDVLNNWIDNRREYLRRVYNKKIRYTDARISILKIFLELRSPEKIQEVVQIIMNNDEDDAVDYLVKNYGMNSYQAIQVVDAKLKSLSMNKMMSYAEELPIREKELEEYNKIARSEKEIDKVILKDLDDLEKYSHPRRSNIISNDEGKKISDSKHLLVFTKKGRVKKLPVELGRAKGYGQFAVGDYPILRLEISNMDSVIIFDSRGRYSVVPVHTIPNCIHSNIGESIYDISKLSGEIVSVYQFYSPRTQDDIKTITKNDAYVFTLTKNGQMKKTSLSEFCSTRLIKNARAIKGKSADQLAMAEVLLNTGNIMVYTKDGMSTIISVDDVPEMGKESVGNLVINTTEHDECRGFISVNSKVKNILVCTEKGGIKRVDCESGLFNSAVPMKRRNTVYLSTLQNDDNVFLCAPIESDDDEVIIWTRKDVHKFDVSEIQIMSRKAICPKKVPVPNGDNIINIFVIHH